MTEQTDISALTRKPSVTYTIDGQEALVSRSYENGRLITKLTYELNPETARELVRKLETYLANNVGKVHHGNEGYEIDLQY